MLATVDRVGKRRYWISVVAALLVLGVLAGGASATVRSGTGGKLSVVAYQYRSPGGDGFDRLPPGLKARSMSSLVGMGLVHPALPTNLDPVRGLKPYQNRPTASIVWGPALKLSNQLGLGYGANEPGAGM